MSDARQKRGPAAVGPTAVSTGEAVAPPAPVAIAPQSMTEPSLPATPESAAATAVPAIRIEQWAALTDMQAALAMGLAEATGEISKIVQSDMAAAGEAATSMLGAKTVAEAVEINARLFRQRLDAAASAGLRLSEIGLKAASEMSRPLLSQFATGRSRSL